MLFMGSDVLSLFFKVSFDFLDFVIRSLGQVTGNKGSTGRTHFQSGFHRLATAWKHGFTAQGTSVVLEVAGLQFLL